jgi:hypothetical protein
MQLFRRRATGDKRDNRAFIVDSYRTILGREPDKVGMLYFSNLLENHQLDRLGVLKAILSSEEAQSRTGGATKELVQAPPGCLRSEAEAVFANFEKYRGTGRPGFVTNFLGGLTDVRFVAGIEFLAGVVEGYPIPGNFHGDVLEWLGTLRAALNWPASLRKVIGIWKDRRLQVDRTGREIDYCPSRCSGLEKQSILKQVIDERALANRLPIAKTPTGVFV